MKQEFIPYEQALELKELGFDEPCIAGYDGRELKYIYQQFRSHEPSIRTPLYQQAFRFFREKYVFYINMVDSNLFYFIVHLKKGEIKNPEEILISYHFKTYEEAELACLKKLIEIIKQPKQ